MVLDRRPKHRHSSRSVRRPCAIHLPSTSLPPQRRSQHLGHTLEQYCSLEYSIIFGPPHSFRHVSSPYRSGFPAPSRPNYILQRLTICIIPKVCDDTFNGMKYTILVGTQSPLIFVKHVNASTGHNCVTSDNIRYTERGAMGEIGGLIARKDRVDCCYHAPFALIVRETKKKQHIASLPFGSCHSKQKVKAQIHFSDFSANDMAHSKTALHNETLKAHLCPTPL